VKDIELLEKVQRIETQMIENCEGNRIKNYLKMMVQLHLKIGE